MATIEVGFTAKCANCGKRKRVEYENWWHYGAKFCCSNKCQQEMRAKDPERMKILKELEGISKPEKCYKRKSERVKKVCGV